MNVTIDGYADGSNFDAMEIDTPYQYQGPAPTAVYYGPGTWYPGYAEGWGPSFSLVFDIGSHRFEQRSFNFGGQVRRPMAPPSGWQNRPHGFIGQAQRASARSAPRYVRSDSNSSRNSATSPRRSNSRTRTFAAPPQQPQRTFAAPQQQPHAHLRRAAATAAQRTFAAPQQQPHADLRSAAARNRHAPPHRSKRETTHRPRREPERSRRAELRTTTAAAAANRSPKR